MPEADILVVGVKTITLKLILYLVEFCLGRSLNPYDIKLNIRPLFRGESLIGASFNARFKYLGVVYLTFDLSTSPVFLSSVHMSLTRDVRNVSR